MGAFYCDEHQMQRDVNGNCWECDAATRAAANERARTERAQRAEYKRLRAAEQWVRAQAAKYPTKPSSGNTYSAGFDVGYALAREQAARAFDAVPNVET